MNVDSATAKHRTDSTRRITLTVGLRDRVAGEPFLEHASTYSCQIEALDPLSQSYGPSNWESGVISGAGFAWRRWLNESNGLMLYRLEGSVGGNGIEAIAEATSAALAALTNHAAPQLPNSNWDVHTESDLRNGHAEAVATPVTGTSGV